MDDMKTFFRPEFLNRVDEIIIFNALSRDLLKKIVEIQVQRMKKYIREKNIDLILTDKAKEYFASQPVFNTFIKRAKLYRVSIGRYENRGDAFSLCDSLKQKDPEEYRSCWINVIP
jgi:hypothetical protein